MFYVSHGVAGIHVLSSSAICCTPGRVQAHYDDFACTTRCSITQASNFLRAQLPKKPSPNMWMLWLMAHCTMPLSGKRALLLLLLTQFKLFDTVLPWLYRFVHDRDIVGTTHHRRTFEVLQPDRQRGALNSDVSSAEDAQRR